MCLSLGCNYTDGCFWKRNSFPVCDSLKYLCMLLTVFCCVLLFFLAVLILSLVHQRKGNIGIYVVGLRSFGTVMVGLLLCLTSLDCNRIDNTITLKVVFIHFP